MEVQRTKSVTGRPAEHNQSWFQDLKTVLCSMKEKLIALDEPYDNNKKISARYPLDQNFLRNPMVQLVFQLDHVLKGPP